MLSAHHEKEYFNSKKNWLAFMHLINAFDKVFVEYAASMSTATQLTMLGNNI